MPWRTGPGQAVVRGNAGLLRRYGMAFGIVCGVVMNAWGETHGAVARQAIDGPRGAVVTVSQHEMFDFNLPAQPLESALYQFGDISRQPALFPSHLITGLTSSAVQGRYSAAAALHLLLAGTGLVAEQAASAHGEIFLLKKGGNVADLNLDGYPALIQARILRALCGNARTVPGSYHLLFRVQIDEMGRINMVQLIDSTGNDARDAALLTTLRQLSVGVPPPAMRQPFIMTLSPLNPGATPPCGARTAGRQR